MDKLTALKRYFGHDSFRPGQEALIGALLQGRDVLGVMPTGGGKSMCYQLPALLLPGLTVVISPLISLMKDQVMALTEMGCPAAFINSSLSGDEARQTYRRVWSGACRLLYVAPERLEAEGFLKLAQGVDISLVAVDEAHCVSQWGQDFRPQYLKISQFLAALPRRPAVGAFTATATGAVREDVVRLLDLRDPLTLVTGFDRPNLYFEVRRPKNKPAALLELLEDRKGRSGIIYCATRKKVEQVCEYLRDKGFPATRYHAGLGEEERRTNQDAFRFDDLPIMVATNAFGMGIDKSNVSYVIHYNMPKSLEAYYQEAGRAGRDGEPADCVLLYGPADVNTARFLIENGRDNDALTPAERDQALRRDYQRLEAMKGYCRTERCLRGYLLDYFGQEHPDVCGNCQNCRSHLRREDITRQAQMILSCVARVEDRLGYCVGQSLIVNILRGRKPQRLLDLGLDRLSTYGLLKEASRQTVNDYVDCLLDKGYLLLDPDHGVLRLTPAAREVLFHGRRVEMAVREAPTEVPAEVSAPARADPGLFEALKTLRYRLAQKEGVPAFMIFSNATLTAMAAQKPQSLAQLLQVSGVGEKKADKYGVSFLLAIEEYERERAPAP